MTSTNPGQIEAAVRPSAEAGFDPWTLLRTLLRYKWLVLAAMLVVPAIATLYALRLPKIYQASAKLEYDPTPPRPLGREVDDVADPISSYWMSKEWYTTQNRIIASRAIAERVVRKLALQHDRSFFGVPDDMPFVPASVETAAMSLQGRISVVQEESTRLVQVGVTDTDPERAQLLANTVAHTYIEKLQEDRQGSTVKALDWLSQQLDRQRDELNDSEVALHAFKEGNNVLSVSLEDHQNILAQEIQQYSNALTAARLQVIDLRAQLQELRRIDLERPHALPEGLAAENLAVGTLRQDFMAARAARRELAVRYGDQHPEMQALDAKLVVLQEQLRTELASITEAVATAERAAQARVVGISQALEHAHQAGLDLNRREIEYRKLARAQANSEKLYNLLLERTTETNLTRLIQLSHVRLLEPALKPGGPISPRIPVFVMSGVLGGLLLGIGLVFGITRLDTTLKSIEEVEALGVTVLGVLPLIEDDGKSPSVTKKALARARKQGRMPNTPATPKDLIVHTQPRSAVAECCRTVRTNLAFMSADRPLNTIMLTSASPLEGKTTLAISLAITLAQTGKRVLLIDTDLRRPRIHRTFGVPANVGMTSVLVGECTLGEAIQPSHIENLSILPCGPVPPNPSELLHTTQFQDTLKRAELEFDRVILDSPPLGVVTDAAIIAPQVGGSILVIQGDRTTRAAAQTAVRALRDVKANILGAVVNSIDLAARRYGYGGYSQHSAYYYASESVPPPNKESVQPSVTPT